MSPAAAWRWCAVAGVATLLASRGFGWIGAAQLCGPGYGDFSAVLSFEFAASPAALDAMFGAEPCRGTMHAALLRAQWWDALAFIPAYTAFLVLGSGAASRVLWRPVVTALALLGGLLDEAEGLVMFAIMGALPGSQWQFDLLGFIVQAKFIALAAGTAGIGALLLTHRRVIAAIPGAAMIAGGLTSLYALATMPNLWLMQGLTYAWVALLIASVAGSVKPSLFSARAAPLPAPAPPSA